MQSSSQIFTTNKPIPSLTAWFHTDAWISNLSNSSKAFLGWPILYRSLTNTSVHSLKITFTELVLMPYTCSYIWCTLTWWFCRTTFQQLNSFLHGILVSADKGNHPPKVSLRWASPWNVVLFPLSVLISVFSMKTKIFVNENKIFSLTKMKTRTKMKIKQ